MPARSCLVAFSLRGVSGVMPERLGGGAFAPRKVLFPKCPQFGPVALVAAMGTAGAFAGGGQRGRAEASVGA
eukprot:1859969-Lingulodinium_polyedra.AAC.1